MRSVLLRVFVFLFVFTLEVKVKANEVVKTVAHETVLQQPENCLQGAADSACALQTDSEGTYTLELANGKVVLDRETAVIRLNDHEVRLVAGTIWVQPAHKKFSVKSEFGEARSENEFWVSRDSDRMVISANFKDVEMLPKGSSEILTVPSGLENTIGRVAKDGKSTTGLPTPIQPTPHLARWARLYKGKKAEFEKEVATFKTLWLGAKGEATDMQQALYQRKIASLETAAAEKIKAREKSEARNREIREHFRRRFFSEE